VLHRCDGPEAHQERAIYQKPATIGSKILDIPALPGLGDSMPPRVFIRPLRVTAARLADIHATEPIVAQHLVANEAPDVKEAIGPEHQALRAIQSATAGGYKGVDEGSGLPIIAQHLIGPNAGDQQINGWRSWDKP
jgi:hypothetical protein